MNHATTQHRQRKAQSGLFLALVGACLLLAIVFIVHILKVHKLEHQLDDTQKQLTAAKADATQAHADLDKAKGQASDLQSQLNQANAGSAQMVSQLDQSKIQTMDLQARLQKAEGDLSQLQPLLLRARH